MPALSQEKLYTNDEECNGRVLKTLKFTKPRYNAYSEYTYCQNSSSYYCQKFINTEINIYIRNNSGSCEVFPAPFSVFLFADNSKYLEPDISVICDKSKIDNKGCRCKRIPDCRPI